MKVNISFAISIILIREDIFSAKERIDEDVYREETNREV